MKRDCFGKAILGKNMTQTKTKMDSPWEENVLDYQEAELEISMMYSMKEIGKIEKNGNTEARTVKYTCMRARLSYGLK